MHSFFLSCPSCSPDVWDESISVDAVLTDCIFCLQPVEREPLIYHLDSTSRRTESDEDLPDEFFEVTMDDVRKRFAQLKSERFVGGSGFESDNCFSWNVSCLQKPIWIRPVVLLCFVNRYITFNCWIPQQWGEATGGERVEHRCLRFEVFFPIYYEFEVFVYLRVLLQNRCIWVYFVLSGQGLSCGDIVCVCVHVPFHKTPRTLQRLPNAAHWEQLVSLFCVDLPVFNWTASA